MFKKLIAKRNFKKEFLSGKTTVICPKCVSHIRVNSYWDINADEDILETQQLFDRSLFTFKCEKCGHVFESFVGHSFTINDVCHIVRQPCKEVVDLYLKDVPNFLLYKNPRIVFDTNSFIEKARIFYMGLDDRLVEIIKVMAVTQIIQTHGEFDFDDVRCWVSEEKDLEISFRYKEKIVNTTIIEFSEYINLFGHLYDYIEKVCANDENSIYIDFQWAINFSQMHLSGESE